MSLLGTLCDTLSRGHSAIVRKHKHTLVTIALANRLVMEMAVNGASQLKAPSTLRVTLCKNGRDSLVHADPSPGIFCLLKGYTCVYSDMTSTSARSTDVQPFPQVVIPIATSLLGVATAGTSIMASR